MDLERELVLGALGTLLVSEWLLVYATARLVHHAAQVKTATTRFIDSFTSYFSARTLKPKDIQRLADLAKYREETGI